MTVVTLTPNGTDTTIGSPAITGAATAHAALSDSSDSSYVTFDDGDEIYLVPTDLTLPSGAVITALSVLVRDKTTASDGYSQGKFRLFTSGLQRGGISNWAVTWTSFTDHVVGAYTAANTSDISDSQVDGASLHIYPGPSTPFPLIVSKLSLQVTYVAKPVTDVTAPTGTITNTNTPAVAWANTLDSSGGAQTKYEIKIFNAAQYGAGGFSPATSSPTVTSGIKTGTAGTWTPSTPLPSTTYRAYVRVAQSVLGTDHWSDWDFIGFTVTANTPGVPTIRAVAQDADGRVWLTIDDTLGATTHAFEVQRSIDGGTTWETIRTTAGGLITPTSGVGRAYDSEVGNGVTVRYQARALNIITAFTTYSAWSASSTPTAWQSQSWWLKSPLHPDLDLPVDVVGMDPLEQDANQGVFTPLGRRLPVVISDARSGFRGAVQLMFDAEADRDDFYELLDLLEPLLLQAPPTHSWTDRYVMLGDLSRARMFDKAYSQPTVETVSWVEVDAPTGNIIDWPAFAS